MKYLIVGLGNPGSDYKNTRHNIGFKVLDTLAELSSISFLDKRYGFRAELKHKGKTLILVKPTTFMNLSGKAVNYYLQTENIPVENMMVIVDDLALPFGTVRIKSKGGCGGHNGLEHIEEILGTNVYNRLRFGIGDEFSKGRQVDYVLGDWDEDEIKKLPERIEIAVEAIKSFPLIGIERTMNYFNNK
jgi:peptidyl-tRNA hydrolase, PTH1 family